MWLAGAKSVRAVYPDYVEEERIMIIAYSYISSIIVLLLRYMMSRGDEFVFLYISTQLLLSGA
jgi:hypothetical protein